MFLRNNSIKSRERHVIKGSWAAPSVNRFLLTLRETNGHVSHAADNLSRNKAEAFKKSFAMASPSPTQVPPGVITLLTHHDHDLNSRHWNSSLIDSCRRDSLLLQEKFTDQA